MTDDVDRLRRRAMRHSRLQAVPARPPVLMALIGVCTAIEAFLLAADLGLIAPASLRSLAYQYAGFWVGLLGTWKPNYTLQPYAMFVTYAFLHGGVIHLAINMATLLSLGRLVLARVGAARSRRARTRRDGGGAERASVPAPRLDPYCDDWSAKRPQVHRKTLWKELRARDSRHWI